MCSMATNPTREIRSCPACGRGVIVLHETLTILHAFPVCKTFDQMVLDKAVREVVFVTNDDKGERSWH